MTDVIELGSGLPSHYLEYINVIGDTRTDMKLSISGQIIQNVTQMNSSIHLTLANTVTGLAAYYCCQRNSMRVITIAHMRKNIITIMAEIYWRNLLIHNAMSMILGS